MNKTTFQISTQSFPPNRINPWKKGPRQSARGSGFAVKVGKKSMVMTNAHVVSNNPFIHIRKWNSDKMYTAKIFDISPEVDLALLEVEDADFWDAVPFFDIGDPPMKGDDVFVSGFPSGGNNASITKGIVSRIEPVSYNRAIKNMALQIDAAVNPGNSGGPIFHGTKKRYIAGVAFLTSVTTQLMCFMIPSFIVAHYIKTVEKIGKFPGVCDLMIRSSNLTNDMLRKAVLGDSTSSGMMVNEIAPTGPASMTLKPGDVITNIEGVDIGNDRMISLDYKCRPIKQTALSSTEIYEKVPYWHIIRMCNPNDIIKLVVNRNGKTLNLKCRLTACPDDLVPIIETRISMDYHILGGFVFTPLNYWHVFPDESSSVTIHSVLSKYKLYETAIDKYKEFEDHEIVILSDIIPTKITVGAPVRPISRLVKINDEDVRNLNHVKKVANGNKDVLTLEFDDHQIIKIDMNDSYNQITKQIQGDLKTGGNINPNDYP